MIEGINLGTTLPRLSHIVTKKKEHGLVGTFFHCEYTHLIAEANRTWVGIQWWGIL